MTRGVILCGAVVTLAGCGGPGVKVAQRGDSCFVDVSFLGEYPSDVRRLQVRDHEKVVWEVEASKRPAQFHWLTLELGENDAALTRVYSGEYRTTVPENVATFELVKDVRYDVLAWDDFGWASRGICELKDGGAKRQ